MNVRGGARVDIQRGSCRIDGVDYPIVGFGTYPLKNDICVQAVGQALCDGYRIIDTATYYFNFDAIAKALKNRDRSQLYLISKVWHDKQAPADLKKDLEQTLKELQIDYLDAYLLHWPNSKISIEKTLNAMEELRRSNKIRHIGLSNISVNHLKRVLEVGIPITWVQVEMNPYFYDSELLKFCEKHSIVVQAWAPLGRGRIDQDALLTAIGKKHQKSASQVAIRWIIQHGCMPLPGSKNPKHIRENRDVTNFFLSKAEMEEIDRRAKDGERERFTIATLGFEDEFDYSYEQCWPR